MALCLFTECSFIYTTVIFAVPLQRNGNSQK